MGFPKQRNTIYKGISASERELLDLAEKSGLAVYGARDIARTGGWGRRRIYNTLASLKRKGVVLSLRRDAFVLEKDLHERSFDIACALFPSSYVSFWTALSFYGYTTQQVSAVQLVSPRQGRGFAAGPIRLEVTRLRPDRFYGYARTGGYVIAEKEKALVDSLFIPSKAGGIAEVAGCVRGAAGKIDLGLFADYLVRFGDRSLVSRAGYIMEAAGLKPPARLGKNASRGYVLLDPGGRRTGDLNARWKIIVNADIGREQIR